MKTYHEVCKDIGIDMPPLVYRDAGVYSITCSVTGKMYIGCSKNILKRLKSHTDDLRKGIHNNAHLQAAWNKHGSSKFYACVIQYTDGNVYEEEKYWIAQFESNLNGFNMTSGGDGLCNLDPVAYANSRSKIAEASRTPEARSRVSAQFKSLWETDYERLRSKRSEAAKKGWAAPGVKEKVSKIQLDRWAKRKESTDA